MQFDHMEIFKIKSQTDQENEIDLKFEQQDDRKLESFVWE